MSRKIVVPGLSGSGIAFANSNVLMEEVAASFRESTKELGRLRDRHEASLKAFTDRYDQRVASVECGLRALNEQSAFAELGRGGQPHSTISTQDRDEFVQLFRTGIRASLSTDSKPDGGYLVPVSVDKEISRLVRDSNTMRQLASVLEIETDSYTRIVSQGGATYNWVAERQARDETAGFNLSELETVTHELSAMPAVTQKLLDDAPNGIAASLLMDEITAAFGEAENTAFINGDGVKRPRGFLQETTVANASYAWGKIGFLKSGDASGFIASSSTASPADCLIDMVYSLKAGYRRNATWLMSSATASVVRKFKDSEGRFLWQDAIIAGQSPTLLGYPVALDESMPGVAGGNFPIAFADWQRAYLIVDRIGIRVLRDPYSRKPHVLFYTTKRVGGKVQDFAAIKLLKIAS